MKIEVEKVMKMVVFERNTVSLREIWMGKTMNSKKCLRENWKVLKTVLKAQNMRFLRLNHVANKSPNQATKHLWDKNLEKLSKCFLWLEGPHARKSRREPWKLPYNLATGVFTCEQAAKPSRENFKNPKFWKIFQVFFATGSLTRQWVEKIFCISLQLGAYDLIDPRPSR